MTTKQLLNSISRNPIKLKGVFMLLMAILFATNVCANDLTHMKQAEEDYLDLPENQIEIAKGSLIIVKGLRPEINMPEYLYQINVMVKELKTELRDIKSPAEIVKTINNYIFVKQRIKFQENKDFMNDVLTNKVGSCNGISSLYLAIAERLQLPFYAVRAPEHLFIRYDDNNVRINIETTDNGAMAPDAFYIKAFNISSLSIEQDIYLKNLTKKQFLASVLNNRGRVYGENGENIKGIDDYSKAISLNPKHAELYINRGNAYKEIGKYQNAILDFSKSISMNPNYVISYISLGGLYGLTKDYNRALENFSKAISLNPENSLLINAYINRAMIYAVKKDKENVFNDLRKVIKLDPAIKNEMRDHTAFKAYWNDEEFKRIIIGER